jgi:hypothetical protein
LTSITAADTDEMFWRSSSHRETVCCRVYVLDRY